MYAAEIGLYTHTKPTAAQKAKDLMVLSACQDLLAALDMNEDMTFTVNKEKRDVVLKGLEKQFTDGLLYGKLGVADIAMYSVVNDPVFEMEAEKENFPKVFASAEAVKTNATAGLKAYWAPKEKTNAT